MYITELADRDIRMKIVPEVQSLNICPTNASVLVHRAFQNWRTRSADSRCRCRDQIGGQPIFGTVNELESDRNEYQKLADKDIHMRNVPEVQNPNLYLTNASVLEKYRTQSIPQVENIDRQAADDVVEIRSTASP